MRYLDSKGLQHAAWVTKNQTAQNWQMTKSKGAVTFYPASQSELEPIVDFMFIETPPAEGEKSLTNPSTIAGVSSVRLRKCGKNLLLHPYQYSSQTINGVEFTVNVDGSITINGTENGTGNIVFWINSDIDKEYIHPGVQYCLSGPKASDSGGVRVSLDLYDPNQRIYLKSYSAWGGTDHSNIISWTEDKLYRSRSYIYVYKNSICNNITFYPQLEIGSSRTDYELGNNHIMDFSLNGTYYGGSLNFKTGELTVTHEGAILDGTLNPTYTALHDNILEVQYNNFSAHNLPFPTNSTFQLSSHFSYNASYTHTTEHFYISEYAKLFLWKEIESVAAYNAWLVEQNQNNTPVTIVWEVKTPYTVQLTPQQILSLPQEDKYVPRINTVHTDQKSVHVGYRRLDCIELRSDQTVHGEKTFADSPLVPDPDDLDSQQAAPISFVKDMLRAEVEAMSGGKNTIIRDQWNNPHVMVRIPKFLLKDIDSSWPNEPHPAFIVNGVQKSEIFIGKYLASQSSSGKAQTLPRQAPWTEINFDDALTACRALGNGFCLNTNASWAARTLWLWKTLGSHEYLGNNNYGRNTTYHESTGVMIDSSYTPGNTSTSYAQTLTGTGGIKWNDDETAYGIADLTGNVWELVVGFRLNAGEIQIIPNNDACLSTCDMTASSTEWKAILQDGTLVAPGTTDTLKYDSAYADGSANVGMMRLNTSITNEVGTGYNHGSFKTLAAVSGVIVPAILKQLGFFPMGNDVQGSIRTRNKGERLALRGGSWYDALSAGPFAFHMECPRTHISRNVGFRTAYIA